MKQHYLHCLNPFEPMTLALTAGLSCRILIKKYGKLFSLVLFFSLPFVSVHAQTKEGKIYVQIENNAVAPFAIDYSGLVITEETHCSAPFNGAIQFPLSGGSGSYTLHWTSSNGFTLTTSASSGTYILSNLEDGNYDVVIEDGSGCEVTESFFVPRNTMICYSGPGCQLYPTNYYSNTSHGCNGTNGYIHFEGSFNAGYGVGPDFNYTVTGPNGYSTSGTATNGGSGNATVDLSSLEAGLYNISMDFIDVCPSGSPVHEDIEIEVKPWYFYDGLYMSHEVSNCAAPNGELFIGTLIDGSSNMSYELSGPDGTRTLPPTSQTVTGLVVGTYTLTITDNDNGCSQTETINVSMPSTPPLSVSIANSGNSTHCEAPYNGFISIAVSGGTGNYSYSWQDNSGNTLSSTSPNISNLSGGTYYFNIQDNLSGCYLNAGNYSNYYILYTDNPLDEAGDISTGFPTANTNCSAPYNGAISVTTPSGSPGPFEYTFYPALNLHSSVDETNPLLPVTTSFTQSTTNALAPGGYYIEVKDLTTGCTGFFRDPDFGPIAVGIPDASTPSLNVTIDNLTDNAACGTPGDGAAVVTVTSGAAYTTTWKNLNDLTTYSAEDPSNLTPGLYELSVAVSCSIGPNQAPVLSSSTTTINTNSNTPAIINTTIGVTDTDDVNMEGATISIGTGFIAAEDQLVFTNQNSITGSYNSSSGVLTLAGTATKAHYQTALRTVRYRSIAIPTFQTRSISFSVTDGQATSNLVSVTITINNQAPLLSGAASPANFSLSSGPVVISNSLTVSDADNTNLQSAEARFTSGTLVNTEDLLVFTNQNGITGNYNTGSGILNLTGTSSVANYQAALRSIQYNNSQASPNTQNRVLQFTVNDGTNNSAIASRTVLVSLSQLPVVITSSGATAFLASAGSVAIDNGVTVADADDTNLESATIQITSASFLAGQDLLLFTAQNGITGNYNPATGLLSLTGTSSLANYQTALQSVQYNNSQASPNAQDRIIGFQVNDGNGNSVLVTKTISITLPNQLPVVTTSSGNSSFVSSSGGTIIDNGVTITDGNDLTLQSATIQISAAYFVAGQDELLFSDQNGINGSYNASSGILSLSGSASLTNYETALRAIRYNNTEVIPDTQNRVIEFIVNDGIDNSTAATRTIVINLNQSPVVITSTGNASFHSSSGGVIIDQSLTVTDTDNAQLQNASVKISSATLITSQDLLLFTNQNGITGNYNSASGELTLTGASSLLNYQTALQSIQYNNSAATPNLQARVIEFQVNDGTSNSSIASRSIQLQLSNEPPVINSKPLATPIESIVTIDLADLITDPDDNIDLTTLKITKQPKSGAPAFITPSFQLNINYSGSRFAGIDNLSIEVCDQLAACAEHELFITVEGDIAIFNGFSPNGDNANPFFLIQNIETLEPKNSVSIFNRWGDNVFEIVDYNNDSNKFTGENKNGNPLPSGTYFYKIEFPSGRKALTGYLTLKR